MEEQQTDMMYAEESQNFNNDNFVAIRLIPERVMKKIELFLSSKRIIITSDNNGGLAEKLVDYGSPLCNKKGINAILNLIEMMINEHTVQGNFENSEYQNYVFFCRRELTKTIVTNAPDWGIPDQAIETIIDSIMRLVKPFFSRTIDNLERESLKPTIQSRQVIHQNVKNPVDKFSGGIG